MIIFDLAGKEVTLKQLKTRSESPDFWQDPANAGRILKQIKLEETAIASFSALSKELHDFEILFNMGLEEKDETVEGEIVAGLDKCSRELDSLELSTFLSGDHDSANAILAINAGAGGTDAQDWAEILRRMYLRWGEGKNYKIEVIDESRGEEAGIKSVTLIITGPYAYGYLKSEKGIHRLVRLSPYNSDQKRHTSFASVEVMPEIEQDTDIVIKPEDLRIDTFRAGGAGGQHVNKTSSAVRLTHIPTGIVAQCQSDRSQHSNKDSAMKVLRARLAAMMDEQRVKELDELRGEKRDIAWGSQIRSYVFHPYTMVKDHRTGEETANVGRVIDGEIDQFINAFLRGQKKPSTF